MFSKIRRNSAQFYETDTQFLAYKEKLQREMEDQIDLVRKKPLLLSSFIFKSLENVEVIYWMTNYF